MGESVVANDDVVRLETDPDGKIVNFSEFVSDLKKLAEKEGIDTSQMEQAAQQAAAPSQSGDEEKWRRQTMTQIQAKRMLEQTIETVDLAVRLCELARALPSHLQKHRQCCIDKAAMLTETFIASIPDPRGPQA